MALASIALTQARTLLNDDAATLWTDVALLPKLAIAHQELQSMLWDQNSPVVREESSTLLVAIAATDLGVLQPADLLVPFRLYEYDYAVGPPVVYSNPVEMTEMIFLPLGVAATTKLIYWAWREEKIIFIGSTVARGVRVQYRKSITAPATAGAEIGITLGEVYLGPRTAALGAMSVGNMEVHNSYTQMAMANFARVLAAQRGQQTALGGA